MEYDLAPIALLTYFDKHIFNVGNMENDRSAFRLVLTFHLWAS